jgi:anaerobic selenocysteine-containing dehydrogenase
MIATVQDGRVVKVEGNPAHGYTRGFLCRKGYRYPERVYAKERILHPLKKVDGRWEQITWTEALDLVAGRIRHFQQQDGPASVMHYQRSASWGATKHLVKRFFNLLGGTTTQSGSLCAGAVMAAQKADFGLRLGNDPADVVNSNTIFIWGKDPYKTSIHMVPLLREAREKGARIVLIDPVRTKTANLADEHVAPRPGTDGYLAAGIAKLILEMGLADEKFIATSTAGYDGYRRLIDAITLSQVAETCDLPISVLERLARLYGERKPASIIIGYGINKWRESFEMIRLIDALGALTGNIGISGGGVNHGFQTRRHFDGHVLTPEPGGYSRAIPEPLLGPSLLAADPPVRMIWINGTNPVASCPDSNTVIKALKSLSFVVVVDHFLTDTADLAHLFLPAATFFEEEDLVVSWGHNWIGPVNKVIEPPGEARSDLRIVQDLATRLGLEEQMAGTPREWLTRVLAPMERAGLSVEQVMEGPVRCPVAPMVAFADRKFPTPSGKFEFTDHMQGHQEADSPYHLFTLLGKHWLNSLILEHQHPELPVALINPAVAAQRGISENARVILRSRAGELNVRVRLSASVREDTIVVEQGTWIKRGGGVNQLTGATISTAGEMAGYYSTTVDIVPLTD